jgi:hypothetical protein
MDFRNKLVFVLGKPFQPTLSGVPLYGRLLALPTKTLDEEAIRNYESFFLLRIFFAVVTDSYFTDS